MVALIGLPTFFSEIIGAVEVKFYMEHALNSIRQP